MISAGSRWEAGYAKLFNAALPDQGLSLPVRGFNEPQNRGKDLFLRPRAEGGAGCASCHRPPTFALDPDSKSNGLRNRQGGPAILNLPPSDLAALAAFLGTLDDSVLRADPRLSNPFRR
jgi:hypothetical protein